MSKHQLHSVKSEHFSIFEQVINLVNHKEHQTDIGLKIVNLAYNMNLEGKRRKLSKEGYLKSVNFKTPPVQSRSQESGGVEPDH
jgi:hypothetical protein